MSKENLTTETIKQNKVISINNFIKMELFGIKYRGFQIGVALTRIKELLPTQDMAKYAEEKFGIKKSQFYALTSIVPLLKIDNEIQEGSYSVSVKGSVFADVNEQGEITDFSPTVLQELVSFNPSNKKMSMQERIEYIKGMLDNGLIDFNTTQLQIKQLKRNARLGLPLDTTNEDTPKEDTPKEDTPKEDTPKEDTPKEDTPKEDTPKEDAPKVEEPVIYNLKQALLTAFCARLGIDPSNIKSFTSKTREDATEFLITTDKGKNVTIAI